MCGATVERSKPSYDIDVVQVNLIKLTCFSPLSWMKCEVSLTREFGPPHSASTRPRPAITGYTIQQETTISTFTKK